MVSSSSKRNLDIMDDCLWTGLTDFNCKVNDFLIEIKDEVPNAVCFALTDKLLTYYTSTLYTYNSEPITIDEDNGINIQIRDNRTIPTEEDRDTSVLINVKTNSELIELTVSLMIYFNKDDTLFASCEVQFLLKSKPNLNIEYLEFTTQDIQLLTPIDNSSIHVINQTIIDRVYGGLDPFVSKVIHLMTQFCVIQPLNSDDSSDVNGILPALVNIIELPKEWRHLEHVVLHFANFYYRDVRIMGVACGCLLVTFTVQSLDKPFPCNCDDFNDFALLNSVSNSRRWMSVGISQDALKEILKPLVDKEINISNSGSTGNGEIRGEYSYWVSGQLDQLRITSDGIRSEFNSITSGGYIAAALRVLKRDIWKKKVGLKITLNDVEVEFQDFVMIKDDDVDKIRMTAQPNLKIGDIDIEMQPNEPVLEWILELVANSHKELLEHKAEQALKFSLLQKPPRERAPHGLMETEYMFVGFFDNSALVLTSQVRWID